MDRGRLAVRGTYPSAAPTPALATGLGAMTVELVFLSNTGTGPHVPFHARFNGTWTTPVAVTLPASTPAGTQYANVALVSHD